MAASTSVRRVVNSPTLTIPPSAHRPSHRPSCGRVGYDDHHIRTWKDVQRQWADPCGVGAVIAYPQLEALHTLNARVGMSRALPVE